MMENVKRRHGMRLRRGHGKSATRQEREREKYKLLKGGSHSRFNARALECNGKISLASEKKSDKIHYNLSAWSPFASALVQVDLAQKGELATFLRGVEGFHARTWGIKNLETKKGSPQFSDIPVISRLLEFGFPLYLTLIKWSHQHLKFPFPECHHVTPSNSA